MKKIFVLPFFLLFSFTSYNQFTVRLCNAKSIDYDLGTEWVNSFKNFRTALYDDNIIALKKFFQFPLTGSNAEFFWLFSDSDLAMKKKFTEKNFEKYYRKIFDKNFVHCLMKIKTDDLVKNGAFEYKYKKSKTESYTIKIAIDKKDFSIILNENSYDPAIKDPIEFSKIFIFTISNGNLKFSSANAAG
jgi:hypothetical protein